MIDPGRPAPRALWSLVLAAGGSSRLGTPKQLLRIRGQGLLSRAVEVAQKVTPGRVVVVLGADALKLRLLIRRRHPRTRTVKNPDWPDGMSGSLKTGLAALPEQAAAALLLLSDQPAVGEASLRRLIGAWRRRPGKAAAARYGGVRGAPAILPRRLWRQTRTLSGDVGIRNLLRQGKGSPTIVTMPEAAWDIDTREDIESLRGDVPLPFRLHTGDPEPEEKP